MKKHIRILIFLLFFFPQNAQALCVGTVITNLPATSTFAGSTLEYNVYDPSEYMQTVNFKVESLAGVGGCRYFVTMDAGASGNASQRNLVRTPDILNYNAYTASNKSNILSNTGTYNGAGVISGSFAYILSVLQSANHSFYWTITPPQQLAYVGASRFQDVNVNLRVWAELALGIFTNTDTDTITFRANADSDVSLSLVDTGNAYNFSDNAQTVNFGNLTSNAALSYDTIIRSNTGYIVKMQSTTNHQVMRHSTYPTIATTIPYSILFGGSPVNLTSGNAITVASSTGTATPASGVRFATKFTVGTLTGVEPPGNYQDIITVTVSSN